MSMPRHTPHVLTALTLALAPLPAAAQPAEWGRDAPAEANAPTAPAAATTSAARKKPARPRAVARCGEEARRNPRVDRRCRREALALAASERAAITSEAAELSEREGAGSAAPWLRERAAALADPVVHLMAAQAWLSVSARDEAPLRLAQEHARESERLADPALYPPRIDAEQVEAIVAESAGIVRVVERRREGARQGRRGKQELIAGAVMLSLAGVGAALLGSGVSLHRKYHNRVDPLAGMEAMYDLTALKERYDLGTTMVTGGALLMVGGLLLGGTLSALGARDLRQGRRLRGTMARVYVAPSPFGLSLSGRF